MRYGDLIKKKNLKFKILQAPQTDFMHFYNSSVGNFDDNFYKALFCLAISNTLTSISIHEHNTFKTKVYLLPSVTGNAAPVY